MVSKNSERGFWAWVRSFLPGGKTPPWMIVEVKEGTLVQNGGDQAAITSLEHHPGFIALMNRMRWKRAVLETQLRTVRQKDIRDVDFLQSGLYWLGYMESEVNTTVANLKNKTVPKLAVDDLADNFEKIRSAIESVGTTTSE